jgi:hypothetical protein
MARIASRVTLALGLAFAMALAGCEKKAVEQKEDLPVVGSEGTGKKSKMMEAGVYYPPHK